MPTDIVGDSLRIGRVIPPLAVNDKPILVSSGWYMKDFLQCVFLSPWMKVDQAVVVIPLLVISIPGLSGLQKRYPGETPELRLL